VRMYVVLIIRWPSSFTAGRKNISCAGPGRVEVSIL
jgi:hypothetical protein